MLPRPVSGAFHAERVRSALYWRYGPHAARKPIDYLEGDTGIKMTEEMAEQWAGHLVPWECDNMVFERSAAKGRSRVERLNQLVTGARPPHYTHNLEGDAPERDEPNKKNKAKVAATTWTTDEPWGEQLD